jgi:hypothetical protein
MKQLNRIFLTIVALISPLTAIADEWPSSFLARVEATALIDRFTEGFETADLKLARALLEDLR